MLHEGMGLGSIDINPKAMHSIPVEILEIPRREVSGRQRPHRWPAPESD